MSDHALEAGDGRGRGDVHADRAVRGGEDGERKGQPEKHQEKEGTHPGNWTRRRSWGSIPG